eukprot:CAMPEP_0202924164 /NCGR_PEP_ID=MMETSP1392-20130828/78829_1 /ASSEMBLY_ACC=CAM_ASM_000868 /TAXON_ID=225041 /ORGANISM="Chlamydomonas chlamydogama, Strain SAG 11-48b" /LENGTH=146 /DNA_ID=CAMNT_0049617879 /DNA_START=1539 /DNA_END=1979 /DNA_ORIENTATION=+
MECGLGWKHSAASSMGATHGGNATDTGMLVVATGAGALLPPPESFAWAAAAAALLVTGFPATAAAAMALAAFLLDSYAVRAFRDMPWLREGRGRTLGGVSPVCVAVDVLLSGRGISSGERMSLPKAAALTDTTTAGVMALAGGSGG